MAAVLLVATHFAIQARTQDSAQATVEEWLQRSGGSVEDVRFHLLRNALTLRGVRLASGDITLYVPEMLLYGRIESLLSQRPSLSHVSMTAPKLVMPARLAVQLLSSQQLAGNSMFQQIWSMAHHLEIHGGILLLAAGEKPERRWSFTNVNLLIQQGTEGRTLHGGFEYRGSLLAVHSQMNRTSKGAKGNVYLSWDRVNGSTAVPEVLGLSPVNGTISGKLQWNWEEAEGSGFTNSHLQGDMQLVNRARNVEKGTALPSLSWQANHNTKGWHAKFIASSWPIAPIRKLTPDWYGRHFAHGSFTGDIDTKWPSSDPEPSSIRVVKGEIRNLDYVPDAWFGDPETRPDWHIDKIQVGNALIKTHRHTLDLGSLKLDGGEIRLLPGQSLQTSASTQWHLDSKDVVLDRLAFALVFPDEKQLLRTLPLSGKASLSNGVFKCDISGADDPLRWRLEGAGQIPWPGSPNIHFNVTGSGLQLTQLRALLPFDDNSDMGAAVQLDGNAGFTLALDVDGDQWTASGVARGQDVGASWQGDKWHAASLTINLDKIGSGLPVQSISKIQVKNWQYQGALQSLTPTAVAGLASNVLFPWRNGIRWRLDEVELQSGSISFGRADSVWGKNIDLKASGWSDGQLAVLNLTGNVGGGTLQAQGHLGRINGVMRADIKGRVLNALPFFLNEWLQVSGAPRIVRGRWSSRFMLKTDKLETNHVRVHLEMNRWLLESGSFPKDPFLERTGFGAHELLNRLGAGSPSVVLNVNEAWTKSHQFAWSDLGDFLLSDMQQKANESGQGASPKSDSVIMESRIRLHGMAEFSQNERIRLHKLLRRMRAHRRLVVDLFPQVQGQHLGEDMVSTIRHTEDMIVHFMTSRGIAVNRVFPVWPTEDARARGGLGIRVDVVNP